MDWITMAWEETYRKFLSWLNSALLEYFLFNVKVENCFCHIIPCPALFICTKPILCAGRNQGRNEQSTVQCPDTIAFYRVRLLIGQQWFFRYHDCPESRLDRKSTRLNSSH